MDVTADEISIVTANGHSISTIKYSSKKDIKKVVIISSATGVLQKYYTNFATYFATQGFIVYTFDYYGIGKSDSATKLLKENTCNLKSWGQNDQAAIVAYAKTENKNAKLTLITHSIGGQILGFNPNYIHLDKIVMIASQSGYWKDFNGIHVPKMWLFWNVIIPVLTPLFGYFPAKKLGLFENLPKNMVYEWAKWGRHKDYMMHYRNSEEYFFNEIKSPIFMWSFSSDDFAPKNTVDWLAQQYLNAKTVRLHFNEKINSEDVKHFGFFKQKFKEPIWNILLKWILFETDPHE